MLVNLLLFSKLNKYLGNLFAVESPGIASNGISYLGSYSAGICAVIGLTSLHNYSEGSII